MKGQSVNIDWTVGLSLFLFAALSSVLFLSGIDFRPDSTDTVSKAEEVQKSLEDETEIAGGKIPLYMETPFNISKVPVDTGFNFPESAYPGSGGMDIPSEINISGERVVAVADYENSSHHMVYYEKNVSNLSYYGDFSLDSSWMNNSEIEVKTASPGITSLRINGNELLDPDADIGETAYTPEEEMLHSSSLNGDLRLYNNSRELVLENEGNGNSTFRIKNLTTLYWGADNSTTDLEALGTRSGETPGFTVASTYGITFTGDMNATVKTESGAVKAEIQSDRFRIRLHDSGYTAGWKRIKAEENGSRSFGAIERLEGQERDQVEELENKKETAFESQFDLVEWSYNITMEEGNGNEILARGDEVPLRDVSVSRMALPLVNRTGSYSDLESRVILWR